MDDSPGDSIMKLDNDHSIRMGDFALDEPAESAPEERSGRSSMFTVIVSGLALLSDGYNAQIIGYMNPLFTVVYKDTMTSKIKSRLSNSYLIGEVFGMLFFGVLVDRVGRKTGIVAATLFLTLGVALATAAHGTTELGMFWMMIVARGVAGFGAGGEYPVCATSATESADETERLRKSRGFLVAATTDFAIDLGFIAAGATAVVVLACFHFNAEENVWRVCFILGVVPPISICFFRLRMINTIQYNKHAIKSQYPYWLTFKRYWKPMLGTSMAWFCYDFVTYPFGLFAPTIIQQLSKDNTLVENIGYGTIINCFYLPGCLIGGWLMDRIGRKQNMTLGFLLWAVWGFILGGALDPIQSVLPLFVIMYGIFNALGEMGPGVSTFLCSAESFPTPLRGHYLGFAAAVGKAGAAIGTQVFMPILNSFASREAGQQAVFLIGSAFAVVGGLIAWFLIPDMSRELETEDVRFKEYLVQNGYDISHYSAEEGGQLVVTQAETKM